MARKKLEYTETEEKKKNIKETKLLESIKEELKDEINNELDNNIKPILKSYVDDCIKKELVQNIEKNNKRVIGEKNKNIFRKNLIIIIQLLIIGLLLFLLYDSHYFDKYFNKDNTYQEISNNTNNKESEKENTPKEPTLDELKETYGKLIEPIKISENSSYIEQFYQGNVTKELKNYIVLNTLDFTKLTIEEDYNIITNNSFKESYKKIWDDSYQTSNIEYNGQKIRYFNKLQSYISERFLVKENTNIVREIIGIEKEKDIVKITTVEGLETEEGLKNVVSKELIEDYEGDSIINYQDRLNTINYVFKNGRLEAITK